MQDPLLTHISICSVLPSYRSSLPPFSWAEYPIVNYSVQVYNRATGEGINSTINATSTEILSMAVPVTFVNSVPHGGVVQKCEELMFIVFTASNVGSVQQ